MVWKQSVARHKYSKGIPVQYMYWNLEYGIHFKKTFAEF